MTAKRDQTMVFVAIFALAMPALLAAFGKPLRGTLLGIPYSFERPTWEQVRRSAWDPDTDAILTPHVYGWGYGVNFRALARRLGLLAT